MRYIIVAPNEEVFNRLWSDQNFALSHGITIHVFSRKRLTVSVDGLSDEAKTKISAMGFEVLPDTQFDLSLDNFCLPYRHTISDLHSHYRPRSEKETTYKLAIEHVQGCFACKRWFQENLCPQMQSLFTDGRLNKDVCTLHRMLHGEEIFDTVDCLSNLCLGSAH